MKFLLAFLFFTLTNCLTPSTGLAAINAKNGMSNSTILVDKQLNLKEQFVFKLSKRKVEPTKKKDTALVVGIVFLLLGLILFFSSSNKSSTPSNSTTLDFSGLGQMLLGLLSMALGCIILFVRFINRLPINNRKKAS